MSGRGKNKFLAILVLSAFSFLCLADEKIAIAGDSDEAKKVADIVSSSLSKQYSLIERTELEKLLKERKLSAAGIGVKEILEISPMIHADYFIAINSAELNNKAVPSRLLIFDAGNGFRLLDSPLPDDIENAAKYSVREIKRALSAPHDTKGKKVLSVLSVRNAGAPKKYEADLANIALEVERNLAESPDVALLERESLSMVSRERDISETFSKLTASAYLLDFEFLPGPTAEHINLSLNILDSSGKKLSQIKIDNCLKYPPKTIETALSELSKFLSLSIPANTVSAKEEAKRFFNEYKFCDHIAGSLSDIEAAERKLEAAIALNPDSPQYRFELALFQMRKASWSASRLDSEQYVNHLIDAANHGIDIIEEIHERFPDFKMTFYHLDIYKLVNILNNYKTPLSQETRKKINAFSARYRKHYNDELKTYNVFDLSNGINSVEEMKNFNSYCVRSSWFRSYLDHEKAAEASFKTAEELLRYGAEFLRKNPAVLKQMSYKKQMEIFVMCPEYLTTQNQTMEAAIKNSDSLIAAAMEHPSPAAKTFGLDTDLFRKTIINNFDTEKFSRDMDIMLNEIEKLELPPSPEAADMIPPRLSDFLYFHRDLEPIYFKKQIEYMRKKGKKVSWYLVRNLFYGTGKDSDKLAANIEFLEPELVRMKYDEKWQNKNELEYSFKEAVKKLSQDKTKYKKALQILDRKQLVKVEKLFSLNSPGYSYMWEIQEDNGKVYVLMQFESFYQIYELDPASEKIILSKKVKACGISVNTYSFTQFHASEKYFLIGGEKKILVIPRNGKPEYLLDDLPGKDIQTVTMMDGRIYVFADWKILFSLLPDGTDRKVHISTLRSEKNCSLDKAEPFNVTALFADPARKRLLFQAHNDKIDGLWEFNLETASTKQLIDFNRAHESTGLRVGNVLYIGAGNFSRNYTFDMETDKVDFVYLADDANCLKYFKGPKPRYVQRLIAHPPFFCREKQLWFGGWSPVFINPENLSYMEYINIPETSQTTLLYPHPDGVSVYAFSRKNIYKLTPQN